MVHREGEGLGIQEAVISRSGAIVPLTVMYLDLSQVVQSPARTNGMRVSRCVSQCCIHVQVDTNHLWLLWRIICLERSWISSEMVSTGQEWPYLL
jgi:hypothetical protein